MTFLYLLSFGGFGQGRDRHYRLPAMLGIAWLVVKTACATQMPKISVADRINLC
jgi:hypothetical protein